MEGAIPRLQVLEHGDPVRPQRDPGVSPGDEIVIDEAQITGCSADQERPVEDHPLTGPSTGPDQELQRQVGNSPGARPAASVSKVPLIQPPMAAVARQRWSPPGTVRRLVSTSRGMPFRYMRSSSLRP